MSVVVMSGTREHYEVLFARASWWPFEWAESVRQAAEVIPSSSIVQNERDGSLLVRIPEGEFLTGGEGYRRDEGRPFHVHLPVFYLAFHPVTNAQYARFLQERRPTSEELDSWISLYSGCFVRRTAGGFEAYGRKDDHPVVQVSWDGAMAYCTWAGLRLPSELEWEKGARGVDGREFPWGQEWDLSKCRNSENRGNERTCSVWSYPEGASPWGLYQMSGNVWEWCADRYDPSYYRRLKAGGGNVARALSPRRGAAGRVLRGGSWYDHEAEGFGCANRDYDGPADRDGNCGFRVARTS